MNLHNPNYSYELRKGKDKEMNIPKMIKYIQIINPIEKELHEEEEFNYNKNEYIEKPYENKEIKIKSDYSNKYPSILKTNLNDLPILPIKYEFLKPEKISEITEEEDKNIIKEEETFKEERIKEEKEEKEETRKKILMTVKKKIMVKL